MKDKYKYMTDLDKLHNKGRIFSVSESSSIKANKDIYNTDDFSVLQGFQDMESKHFDPSMRIETMEELEQRDAQRKKDGFRSKLKILSRPVSGGKEFIQVPIVDESKLVHGPHEPHQDSGTGGSGDEEEGTVIGEKEIEEQGKERKAGDEHGDHGLDPEVMKEIEEMIETELPNLQDKGKKVPVDEWEYELGDVFRGRGQILNRRKTQKNIIETNIILGRFDIDNPDPKKFVIPKSDMVYNIFSLARVYKSKAKVFFCRDYSGSMSGVAAETAVRQQTMLYMWLMKQYGEKLVEPYFVLHDTDAHQVFNFNDYFYATTAGGTMVSSCFKLVNKIIESENMVEEYNIFVFYATDGDDWDREGRSTVPQLKKLLGYVNRMGVVIIQWDDRWTSEDVKTNPTVVENYIKESRLLNEQQQVFRMFVMKTSQAGKEKDLEAVKTLIAK